jgi:hypothetical protein
MLWDSYSSVIDKVNLSKVFKLSIEQIEVFACLKMRSLSLRIPSDIAKYKGENTVSYRDASHSLGLYLTEAAKACRSVEQLSAVDDIRFEIIDLNNKFEHH